MASAWLASTRAVVAMLMQSKFAETVKLLAVVLALSSAGPEAWTTCRQLSQLAELLSVEV